MIRILIEMNQILKNRGQILIDKNYFKSLGISQTGIGIILCLFA
jgi:hypothetical protein